MKKRRHPIPDDYDGLVQYAGQRITPERRSEIAREALALKENSAFIDAQDRHANETPVGGMQFR